MQNYSNAAKAVIIKDNKVLLIKRRPNDPHRPSEWDIPGGRLNPGENPLDGIKREVREETTLEIAILLPLAIQHFTRQDGQIITLIIFLCKPSPGEIKLSEEHTEHQWLPLSSAGDDFPFWLQPVIQTIFRYRLNEFI
jgi:8-oxo-dGTP diphosphatase